MRWCSTLSDPAMEEALHDMPPFRDFAGLGGWSDRFPFGTAILRVRHLMKRRKLSEQRLEIVEDMLIGEGLLPKVGTVADSTLTVVPSSTKNSTGERTPEIHQSGKANQ